MIHNTEKEYIKKKNLTPKETLIFYRDIGFSEGKAINATIETHHLSIPKGELPVKALLGIFRYKDLEIEDILSSAKNNSLDVARYLIPEDKQIANTYFKNSFTLHLYANTLAGRIAEILRNNVPK